MVSVQYFRGNLNIFKKNGAGDDDGKKSREEKNVLAERVIEKISCKNTQKTNLEGI